MGVGKILLSTAAIAISFAGASAANAVAYVNDFYIDPAPTINSNFYLKAGTPSSALIIAAFQDIFNGAPVGSTFDDTFHFNVNFLSNGSGSVSTSVNTVLDALNITGIFFNGVDYSSSLVQTAGGTSASIGNLVVLDTQENTLRFTGTVTGTGYYNGTATITAAAVPEPASWAMMVVGFGLLGAACRRSRATSTKVAFS